MFRSPLAVLILIPIIYFYPFFLSYIPFPGEALKAYYPWKDLYFVDPPFVTHNFDLFDTVRAIYPWQTLSVEILSSGNMPYLNEYAFGGAPLLANNQSAPFYPLNWIMFFDYKIGWGLLTLIQPILASIFMFYLLKEYKLKNYAAFWGALSFSWSGIMAYFLNQHVVSHTLIWLPLIILSLHKLYQNFALAKKWYAVFILSLTLNFLAGHLQTALYNLVFIILYILVILKPPKNILVILTIGFLISFIISSIQILPTINYLFSSYRSADFYQSFLIDPLQWGRLLVPKFLGSIATNNWYSQTEIRESAYISSLGFLFIFFIKKSPQIKYFIVCSLLIIFFTTQNPISSFLYEKLSFLKTVSPTRSFGLLTFFLSILSAFGLQNLFENQKLSKRNLLKVTIFLIICWGLVFYRLEILKIDTFIKQLLISPIIFSLGTILILLYLKLKRFKKVLLFFTIALATVDLIAEHALLARTFTPYNKIFPETSLTTFLQQNLGDQRFLSLDPWILPPNTNIPYKLKTVSVYDPLQDTKKHIYFQNWQNKFDPNSKPFTRAVELTGYSEKFLNENNIKYVLTLKELQDSKLKFINKFDGVLIYQYR